MSQWCCGSLWTSWLLARIALTQFEYGTQTNSGKMYWVPTRIFWGKDRVCVKIGGPYSQGWSMWRIFPRVRMWRLPWGERRIGIAASKIKRRPWRLHIGSQMKKGGSTWMEKGASERWNRLSAGGKLDWGPKNLKSYDVPWTAPAGLWSMTKSGGLGPTWGLIGMHVPQPHLDSHPRVCVLMILGPRVLTAVNRPDLFSEATLNYWLGEGQKWTHRRSKKSALEIWRK